MKAIVVYDLIISQAALYSQRVKNERKSFFEQNCATKFEFETGFADLAKVLLEEGTKRDTQGNMFYPLLGFFAANSIAWSPMFAFYIIRAAVVAQR